MRRTGEVATVITIDLADNGIRISVPAPEAVETPF
jgi:hypothetical protein